MPFGLLGSRIRGPRHHPCRPETKSRLCGCRAEFSSPSEHYQSFIPKFARIAQPLHALTCKGAKFNWTGECQRAFSTLKEMLTEVPVLAHPHFDTPFVLETDASIKGLGTVLSQSQDDGKLHPVPYASRALTPAEKNYRAG